MNPALTIILEKKGTLLGVSVKRQCPQGATDINIEPVLETDATAIHIAVVASSGNSDLERSLENIRFYSSQY